MAMKPEADETAVRHVPRPVPRTAAMIAAVMLAVLSLLAAIAPVKTATPPFFTETEAALAEVKSGEATTQANEVAAEDGLVANGSPCFMRHKRLALGVDQGFRQRFAAASLATDPATKERLLSALAADAAPGVPAWRIAIARAEVALRSGGGSRAGAFIDAAALQDVPSVCRADEAFLRAVTASPRQAAALLDIAAIADPGYWAAQEMLALLSARGTGADPVSCDADAARTIRSATQLAALAQVDAQFQRLERALGGMMNNARVALLLGTVRGATGRRDDAVAIWRSGLGQLNDTPCDAVLRRALEGMIANMESAE